ncbi:signal peptidase II [Rubinisphaera margarita]|uniref:signal peptidase II n=1 Tax=Rubinisphaera margarita TaxID=2909586 RepID=UPI001EE86FB8|nr:signal peptidase II [Rubinisphaera margarita]MCG6156277.1 signal peptidase II [Rubinisphaera margarita]
MRVTLFVIASLLVDQLSKIWAQKTLIGRPAESFFADTFRLVYAENMGTFLGLGANAPLMVRFTLTVIVNAILLGGIVTVLLRKKNLKTGERWGLAIVLAGGLGNMIDRLFRQGIVIDFMNLGVGPVRTGIFNIADVLITWGVVQLAICWWSGTARETPASEQHTDNKKNVIPVKLSALLLVLSIGGGAHAQADTVVYRSGSLGGRIALNGQILDFNQRQMSFRVKSPDTIKEIPTEDVVAYLADRKEPHQKALEALRDGSFAEADRLLGDALAAEPRMWMQREILASQIEVAVNRGEWLQARLRYDNLLKRDTESRSLDLIPLHWHDEQLTASERSWALETLAAEESIDRLTTSLWLRNSYDRLIACSWLLVSPDQGSKAEKMIRELLYSPVPEIRSLARCQLWRRELLERDLVDGDLERWERQLIDLSESYRSGPMFVLGRGYERIVQKELASARYLWLTMIDARNVPLTRTATLRTADLLESLGQLERAEQLRQEAASRFPVVVE